MSWALPPKLSQRAFATSNSLSMRCICDMNSALRMSAAASAGRPSAATAAATSAGFMRRFSAGVAPGAVRRGVERPLVAFFPVVDLALGLVLGDAVGFLQHAEQLLA